MKHTLESDKSYLEFLEKKQKRFIDSGFDCDKLNPVLFPFQEFIVRIALKKGIYAIFADCGLGKTFMQLSWAEEVSKFGKVIIFAPLAVVEQTIQIGEKNGFDLSKVTIINYEQIDNINPEDFVGIILDESSILKNFEGKYKKKICELFSRHRFKLACTATPSPNDDMEICNHAEFLGIKTRSEILATYFIHDGGETSKWRLKGHAEVLFWDWVKTWSCMITNPSDIGFDGSQYILPELKYFTYEIKTQTRNQFKLFNDTAVSATNFNEELRFTMQERMEKAAEIVNGSNESFIVWIKQNEEGEYLRKLIIDAVEIRGSDVPEKKKFLSLWFGNENNECKCNTKEEKKNTNLNIGRSITKETSNQSTQKQRKDFQSEDQKILNTEKKGNNTQKSIIKEINQNSLQKANQMNQKKGKIQSDAKGMLLIQNLEPEQSDNQKKQLKETLRWFLKIPLRKITESHLKNITPLLKSKMEYALFVEQNPHYLNLNKGFTLTTVTKQEKLEDCYAPIAIKESENSMIQKYCSNVQFCTSCGKVKRKILISKIKILSLGLNYQNCHNQVFASIDFSFEGLYQGIRRSYRFGQKNDVNIHIITTDTMQNVIHSINRKQEQFNNMKQRLLA